MHAYKAGTISDPSKHVLQTNILGARISRTSYEEVAEQCRRWITDASCKPHDPQWAERAHYICVTSAHGIITALLHSEFRSVLNGADIATPDGMPVVWALRSFGARSQSRVYGPVLMSAICEQAQLLDHRIFLYGGKPEVVELLSRRLQQRFPKLKICGTFSPPFRPLTEAEDRDCVQLLKDSGADIVFVGLSTPKQEQWMADHCELLPGKVLVGVGAAFDFHAGTLRQAPAWMQHNGLEWLFRLLMEPRRLWKRYIVVVPLFFCLWPLQKLKLLQVPD